MEGIGKPNKEEKIGSDYIIQEKLGSGGQANVFLVTKKGEAQKYAAKVFKKENNSIYIEIKILEELKHYNNPYIINIIENGKGEIVRNNRETKNLTYFIMENAPNGNIFDYIYCRKSGLGELHSKIVFQKILKGFECCHEHNICHRDIKLENLLLDDEYIPKICDFGLACFNSNNITHDCGTKQYKPPEINGKNKYDGIKVDIFYLASALMILTTGLPGFLMPNKGDYFFIEIIKEDYDSYWEKIDMQMKAVGIKLSPEFKNLYTKMINIKPEKRPNITEILKDPWFKEIDDMKKNNKERFDILENEISEIFCSLRENVKNNNKKEMEVNNKKSESASYNRDIPGELCFGQNLVPKYIDTPLNVNNCINIKGYINPVNFMNNLYNMISRNSGDDCSLIPDNEKLKFKINITEKTDDKNENEDNEILKLSILVKLYKYPDGHVLRCKQKEGNRKDFLDKFEEISEFVKKIISQPHAIF